jgi:hypothetical protein
MWLRRFEELFSGIAAKQARASAWEDQALVRFRELTEDQRLTLGSPRFNNRRPFFPHRAYYLPTAGPDALFLASRMCGVRQPGRLWEILLYARGPILETLPDELFFDKDLIWHQQHLGIKGHVAFAYLAFKNGDLYGLNYVSDLVQRISRRRAYKTRIEAKFKSWPDLLLNAILNFAVEHNVSKFYSPRSHWVMRHTDRYRPKVGAELFERVYDRAVARNYAAAHTRNWWVIDVAANSGRLMPLALKEESYRRPKTICICHDIERGLGHTGNEAGFGRYADGVAPQHLQRMLSIEREKGVRATYSVTGILLDEVRGDIEDHGHCIAFHSYDHVVDREQLARCRRADYRIRGYRPPQSELTTELRDENLSYHNFDWLAIAASKIGASVPVFQNGVVKIPILFDDYDLYRRRLSYRSWEQEALSKIETAPFAAFGLHDCYADYWLDNYREFLDKLRVFGEFQTLDEVTSSMILASAT